MEIVMLLVVYFALLLGITRRLRRRVAVASWCAAALAVTAVVAPVSLAAGPVAGQPQYRLTATDNARAAQALVRMTDLNPAIYRVDPEKFAAPRVARCPGLYTPDRSRVTITGKADAFFTNGGDAIGSSAAFFRSHGDLDEYWTRTVRPAFATCLAKMYAVNVPDGLHTEVVSVRARDIGPTGATRTAAYRIVVRYWNDAGQEEIVYRTIVFMSSGRGLSHIVFADRNHECGCEATLVRRVALRLLEASRS